MSNMKNVRLLKPVVNEELVGLLEELLKDAREGELKGAVILCTKATAFGWCGAGETHFAYTCAAMEAYKYDVLSGIADEGEAG